MGAEQRRKARRRREREIQRLREVRAAAAEQGREERETNRVDRATSLVDFPGAVGRGERRDGTGAGRGGTRVLGARPETAAQRSARPRESLPWAAGPWLLPDGDPIAEYIGSVSDREDARVLLSFIDDPENVREIVHMAIGRRSDDKWMLVVLRDFSDGREGLAVLRGDLWSARAAKEAVETMYADWGLPFPTERPTAPSTQEPFDFFKWLAAEEEIAEENLIAEYAGPAGLADREEVRMVVEPEEGSGETIRMIVGRHADGAWRLFILRRGKLHVYRPFSSAAAAWEEGEEACAGWGRVTFRCGRAPAPSDTTVAQAPS